MAHVHYDINKVEYAHAIQPEQMGTKRKFWYEEGSPFNCMTLFKAGRPNTGENWAEVIAGQLAGILQIPAAEYQFAACEIDGEITLGTITPTLIKESTSRMIHGNELLDRYQELNQENIRYNPESRKHHTLNRVSAYLRQEFLRPPIGCTPSKIRHSAFDFFLGYIIFDALIGNQDRHAENWAIIRRADDSFHLCPSYDHGSSLGRNESDDRKLHRLTTADKNGDVKAYCLRATSGFFDQTVTGTGKSIKLTECVKLLSSSRKPALHEWLSIIKDKITEEALNSIIDPIPEKIMSDVSKNFTKKYIEINRNHLLAMHLG